jgi:hypothetical protein
MTPDGDSVISTTTNSAGEYRIRTEQVGLHVVAVQPSIANRYSGLEDSSALDIAPSSRTIDIVRGSPSRIDFALEDGGTVVVEVRSEDGMPVFANYVCVLQEGDPSGVVTAEVQTDVRGQGKVRGAPVGRVIALARDGPGGIRSRSEPLQVLAGHEHAVRIDHAPRRGLMVKCVLPDGSSPKMDSVVARDKQGHPVSTGLLTSKGEALLRIPFGEYVIVARKGRFEGSMEVLMNSLLTQTPEVRLHERIQEGK